MQQALLKAGLISAQDAERAKFDRVYELCKKLETAQTTAEVREIYTELYEGEPLRELFVDLATLNWSIWKSGR